MGVMNYEQLRMEVRIVHVDHFTETIETSFLRNNLKEWTHREFKSNALPFNIVELHLVN